ncbi:MAG: magnesium/cobalt transporter CorA [Candidatus Thermoplasmatota archaeon]|nr:magnesium/cobalt transporter CorA [Candidatus Thermoplasmatota archaeon]
MSRYLKKRSHTIGLSPGSLIHVGTKTTAPIKITVFDYNENHVEEKELNTIQDCFPYRDSDTVTWINIDGVHDAKTIELIGSHFNIHPLVLEDIMNTGHRPKIESFDEYLHLVLKMLYSDEKTKDIQTEQISIIITKNVVLSFQERPGDVFNKIRQRIRNGKGRIRKMGADYLAYALVDAIIDHYFVIMESIGETIEFIEDELVENPKTQTLQSIHQLKTDMIFLRRSVWPLREIINSLIRDKNPLITDATEIYLRDLYDHIIQVIDTIETYRDMISGMLEIYMSSVSNKMNEVMKVLTIFASIFIPLTFIAGVYGMNFNPDVSPYNMPELNWFMGYPFVLVIMTLLVGIMIIYFKRKNWF